MDIVCHCNDIWRWNRLQYIIFAAMILFDIAYIQHPPLWCRILLLLLLTISFFVPYIRQFTTSAIVIFTWLITFYAIQYFPNNIKPQHISVNILPTLERIIYGANLAEIISVHTHPILDIFSWIPYGIIHFTYPFILSIILFIYSPPGTLSIFAKAFGYMNLFGVLTQLLFPNSPPWYELTYGSATANYAIHGQPGGLERIDDILGIDLYGSTFGNSPIVFGAFPSLHSGCATLEMLFLSWLCPKMTPYCIFHMMWMWFATMYLTHHYLIDLVGGSIYAFLTFYTFRSQLPKIQSGCHTRLDYITTDIPLEHTFMNYIGSIELDKLIDKMRNKKDVESILFDMADDIDSSNSVDRDRESANENIPLCSFTADSSVCSSELTNSPSTCSNHSSPVTPHSDLYPQLPIK
ncbi:hypothetical protein BDB01DRAFT_739594 [Pilobolus umbonatus]|nr:hypothetical protein BDB01DRAFT_739594 [Pilobolus umbonatus]